MQTFSQLILNLDQKVHTLQLDDISYKPLSIYEFFFSPGHFSYKVSYGRDFAN